MVDIKSITSSIDDQSDDFVASFDVVCATGCGLATLKRLDKICRDNKIKFFAGDVFGYYGFMFTDLGTHEYAE